MFVGVSLCVCVGGGGGVGAINCGLSFVERLSSSHGPVQNGKSNILGP